MIQIFLDIKAVSRFFKVIKVAGLVRLVRRARGAVEPLDGLLEAAQHLFSFSCRQSAAFSSFKQLPHLAIQIGQHDLGDVPTLFQHRGINGIHYIEAAARDHAVRIQLGRQLVRGLERVPEREHGAGLALSARAAEGDRIVRVAVQVGLLLGALAVRAEPLRALEDPAQGPGGLPVGGIHQCLPIVDFLEREQLMLLPGGQLQRDRAVSHSTHVFRPLS